MALTVCLTTSLRVFEMSVRAALRGLAVDIEASVAILGDTDLNPGAGGWSTFPHCAGALVGGLADWVS
jgi:hypothetical protein